MKSRNPEEFKIFSTSQISEMWVGSICANLDESLIKTLSDKWFDILFNNGENEFEEYAYYMTPEMRIRGYREVLTEYEMDIFYHEITRLVAFKLRLIRTFYSEVAQIFPNQGIQLFLSSIVLHYLKIKYGMEGISTYGLLGGAKTHFYFPTSLKYNNLGFHCDGDAAIVFRNKPYYYLNGVEVDEYLATTPSGKLEWIMFHTYQNADVRTEFIRKYGIDRLISRGKVIDSYLNYPNSRNYEWYKKSEYKVIDMYDFHLFPKRMSSLPYLYMKNQTTHTYHVECCARPDNQIQPSTLIECLTERLGFNPEEVDILDIK